RARVNTMRTPSAETKGPNWIFLPPIFRRQSCPSLSTSSLEKQYRLSRRLWVRFCCVWRIFLFVLRSHLQLFCSSDGRSRTEGSHRDCKTNKLFRFFG